MEDIRLCETGSNREFKWLGVLLAGENSTFRLSLQYELRARGYRVIAAANREALENTIGLASIHVCLLDWGTRQNTAIEFCKLIRSADLAPRPYILLLTSQNEPKCITSGYRAGADDYISKPFSCEELAERISLHARRFPSAELLESEVAQKDLVDAYRSSLKELCKSWNCRKTITAQG